MASEQKDQRVRITSPYADPVGLPQWRPDSFNPRKAFEIFDKYRRPTGSPLQRPGQPGPSSSSSSTDKAPPEGHRQSRRRAVIAGCEYIEQDKKVRLRGCMNDVALVYDLLTNELGFDSKNIVILTDEITCLEKFPKLTHRYPTKTNILKWLNWLVDGAQAGDSLWFSFSGHGIQLPDNDDDEFDGFDEALLSSDMEPVIDDEIFSILKKLPPGARLTGLIDACNSGTGTFDACLAPFSFRSV